MERIAQSFDQGHRTVLVFTQYADTVEDANTVLGLLLVEGLATSFENPRHEADPQWPAKQSLRRDAGRCGEERDRHQGTRY